MAFLSLTLSNVCQLDRSKMNDHVKLNNGLDVDEFVHVRAILWRTVCTIICFAHTSPFFTFLHTQLTLSSNFRTHNL